MVVVPDGGPDGKTTGEVGPVVAGSAPLGAHSEQAEARRRNSHGVAPAETAGSPTSPSSPGGDSGDEKFGHSFYQDVGAKGEKGGDGIEAASDRAGNDSDSVDEYAKIYVPDDSEEVIDPRLADYPVPLVAKTVDLHNDFK